MSLSEQDRDWVKAMGHETARAIIKEVIVEHISTCPHGKRLSAGKNMVLGVCLGAGIFGGGGGVGFWIAKLISQM